MSNVIASTTCSACGKPTQGAFVRALGGAFHLNCFKCMDCGDVVASKFFPIDSPDGKQNPLCERDYFRRLNLVCTVCGMALRGSYITACNKKYHVEHFTCSLCPTLFGPKDSYYEHDGEVYCHFHYSIRFATRCIGCSTAILKQFVEINRNNRDECWHPECYMINKFWNVKISTRTLSSIAPPSSTDGNQQEQLQVQSKLPEYVQEEQTETPAGLKEKQVRMEQLVYRIWTVLSAFEESSAACISDMLRQVSDGCYLDAIRMADKFILHVEVLFGTIDDLEWMFAARGVKGMSHVREARMLCRKTVDLFTLLSGSQNPDARRLGMTQELLTLVTGLAHYLKILIRIALTGALKLERGYGDGDLSEGNQQQQALQSKASTRANGELSLAQGEVMASFLDKLHLLTLQGGNPNARRLVRSANSSQSSSTTQTPTSTPSTTTKNPGTQGVTYGYRSLAPENAGESPFWTGTAAAGQSSSSPSFGGGNPPTDLCVRCGLTVEEDCVRLGTFQRWHSQCIQCARCSKVAAVPAPETPTSTSTSTSSGPNRNRRRPPARVHEFVYDPDSLQNIPHFGQVPVTILCTEHAHAMCQGGFHAVERLEQYAFLLNVALRRLYLLLKKRGLVSMLVLPSESSAPISDVYRNSDSIVKMQPLHPRASSVPKRSTVIESSTGKNAASSSNAAGQYEQEQVVQRFLPKLPPQPQPAPQKEERQTQQFVPTINPSNSVPARRTVSQIFNVLGITVSRKPKERPVSDDVATNVVNNSLGRADVIPREILERKELPAVPIEDSNFEEPEPFEVGNEDEPESPTTSDSDETVEPISHNTECDPAPWILASRKLHVPQKPLDSDFLLQMAGLRRQVDGASLKSTNSTIWTRQFSLLESRESLDSSIFSDSGSILSLPSEVEFPPTPVFKDEIPNLKGLTIKAESNYAAQTANLVSSPKDSRYPFQNSQFTGISTASTSRGHVRTPTGRVRRGYWNRRGDHLTPDGYVVFPPLNMQYPAELRMYPFENEGYQDHSGMFIAYVRRPELPQSLPKHGKPPERPYESFVIYL